MVKCKTAALVVQENVKKDQADNTKYLKMRV